MAYKIPSDIPLVPATWQDWPVEARLRAAMLREDAPVWARLSAVAISMNEQPGKIPVGNCCGLMAQGDGTMPWGWKVEHWAKAKPIGYALLNEGQGIKGAPFLAFAKPEDSLSFLIDRCVSRQIDSGERYAVKWVGTIYVNDRVYINAVAGFNHAHDKVVAALWQMAARLDALPVTGPT